MKRFPTQPFVRAGLFRSAALAAACAFLCSCASVPLPPDPLGERLAKRFDPPPVGWSGLYVYRTGVIGSSLKRKVWVDGQYAGETGHRAFLHRLVRPGRHWVQTESALGPRELSVEFEEGRNHFVQQRFSMSGGKFDDDRANGLSLGNRFFGDTDLVVRSQDVAAAVIVDLHLVADPTADRAMDLPDADYAEGMGSFPTSESPGAGRVAPPFPIHAPSPRESDNVVPNSRPGGGAEPGVGSGTHADEKDGLSTDAEVRAAEEEARLRAKKLLEGETE